MATVYLAEDLKHRRRVAVKVMRPELAAALGGERFFREIELAARLTHPHILPLHDSGKAGEFLYYVMPYIEGESLRAKLARGGELPIGEAVRILRDVVDALSEAHEHGVVHRDIKPENILLSKQHALVTDFGVAKAVDEATGRQALTTAGVALGTPTYMAPEQAAADTYIDHRADIYAVGALGYELLTGRPPFVGPTAQSILTAHVTRAPEEVTKHRPTVPGALAQLIMRCLEKKPADRWQRAEELLPQLEALMTPSGGVTPTTTRPVGAVSGSRRKSLVGGGGLLAVLVLAAAGWWLLADRGRAATDVVPLGDGVRLAVLPLENLSASEEDEYFSDGITRDLNAQISKLGGFIVIAHGSARRLSSADRGYGEVANDLGARYLVDGSVRRGNGRVHINASLIDPETGGQLWTDVYDRADSVSAILEIQSDIARQVAAVLSVDVAPEELAKLAAQPTTSTEAYDAYQLGRFFWNKRTDEGLRRAIDYFSAAVAADSEFALAYVGLADAYLLLPWYAYTKPLEAVPLAEAAALRALAIDSAVGEAYASLAGIRDYYDWDLDGAEEAFRRAIALSPNYATARQWHGSWLVWVGRIDEGVAELRRALELDPLSLIIRQNLSDAFLVAHRVEEAIGQYRRMQALDSTFAPSFLGWVHVAAGRLEDALAVFDRYDDNLGRMHAYARLGDHSMARQLYEEVEQSVRQDSQQRWVSGFTMASAALAIGDTSHAFELMEQAVEERDPRLSDMMLRRPPWEGLWSHERFRGLMNSMGLDVVGDEIVPLEGQREG
jgi:serine/threonine-protein kinase